VRTAKRDRAARWLSGSGIEIGALHNPLPVPDGLEVRYVDRATEAELRSHYPELDGQEFAPVSLIGDAEDLTALADESVDFVIANHLLEHLENPIRGLAEMTRVLRSGGVLYLALPDPRATFDRNRPVTPTAHVVEEYRGGTEATRRAHYAEWVEKVLPLTDGHEEDRARQAVRAAQLDADGYSIHFHVWRPETFFEVLVAAMDLAGVQLEPLEFMACDSAADDEYILVLRKGALATPPDVPPLPSEVEVATLRSALERISAQCAALEEQRARAEQSVAEEREARRRAEEALATLTSSRSWRVTVPLRAAAAAVRRLRRPPAL
jgi:SAM-dependent methyltransferase